ncbi:MAG: hypothetical protein AAFV72_00120 [Cyanobacteria bacterium J06635_1]
MVWQTGTIKLEAAKAIFEGVDFERIEDDKGKTVAFRATYKTVGENVVLTDASLTSVCNRLWRMESGVAAFDERD